VSTCVFYIDEAGSSQRYSIPIRPDRGQTAIFCLFALALPLSGWRHFDREYLQLKRKFFPKEIAASTRRAEQWEVKGNELCSPRNKDSQRRHAFLGRVFELGQRYEATAFGITFIKKQANPMGREARYCMGLQYLAERFNAFLAESSTYDEGILIADSRMKSLDLNVAVSYLSYIFGHETGRLLTQLAESPLFADSRLTAGLQIADNIAAVLFANHYHYYCSRVPGAPDYSHIPPRYWSRLDAMQFKSRQLYDEYPMYGFRVCDHR